MSKQPKPEVIAVSAPMSYTGSAKRIFKLTHIDNALLKWPLLVPIALILTLTAWVFVTLWYLIFGILVIPYRLLRRSQHKAKRDNIRHRELPDQINKVSTEKADV